MRTKLVHAYSGNSLAPPNIRSDPSSPIQEDFVIEHGNGHNNHLHPLDHRKTGVNHHRASIISSVDLLHDLKESRQDNSKGSGSGVPGYFRDLSSRTFRKKTLYKKVPFLSWIQDYNTNTFVADLIAGFIISLSFLPQSLAYATIAGLPPQVNFLPLS